MAGSRAKAAASRAAGSAKSRKTKDATQETAESASPEVPAAPRLVGTGDGGVGPLQRLRATVKVAIDDVLAGCVAWTSTRNERGKTARLDALRLALTGKHPAQKRGAGLLSLALDGRTLVAEATGKVVSASYQIPAGRVTGDHTFVLGGQTARPTTLPDLLTATLTDKELRTLLLASFPVGVSLAPPFAASDVQQAQWQRAIVEACDDLGLDPAKLPSDASGRALVLSTLGAVLQRTKRQQAAVIAANTKQAAERRAQLAALGAAPMEAAVVEAENLVAKTSTYEQALDVMTRVPVVQKRWQDATERKAQLVKPADPDFTVIDRTVAEAQQSVEAAETALAHVREQNGLILQISLLRRKHVEIAERQNGHAQCLVCESATELDALRIGLHQVQQLTTPLEQQLAARELDVTQAKARLRKVSESANAQRAALMQTNTQYQQAASAVAVEIASCEAQLAELGLSWARVLKAAEVDERDSMAVMDFAAKARQAGTEAEVNKARAEELRKRFDAYAEVQQLELSTATLAQAQHALEGLQTAAKQHIEAEVRKLVEPVEAAVNYYMPQTLVARLVLSEPSGDACCRFEVKGFDGEWRAFGAAPGRAWAALSIAVALAMLPDGDSELRIVLLDDTELAAFSPEARSELLGALAQAQRGGKIDHVFVACTQPETIPAGYLVYKLD